MFWRVGAGRIRDRKDLLMVVVRGEGDGPARSGEKILERR